LSFHVSTTLVSEPATATRPDGAAGGTEAVLALTTVLYAEAPPASIATTRY
jgi:hypothetical protein